MTSASGNRGLPHRVDIIWEIPVCALFIRFDGIFPTPDRDHRQYNPNQRTKGNDYIYLAHLGLMVPDSSRPLNAENGVVDSYFEERFYDRERGLR